MVTVTSETVRNAGGKSNLLPEVVALFFLTPLLTAPKPSAIASFAAVKKIKQKFPLHPKHPERICWGCDKYCPADALTCGNGSGRTEPPVETLGADWYLWGDWSDMFDLKPDDPPASTS
jgi:hypothetical protein